MIAAQVEQAKSAAELNEASAMKARAEAWQTANYAGPEADARTAFGRMATPIFPIMDNLHMDTFFFFVPYRLVWLIFVLC